MNGAEIIQLIMNMAPAVLNSEPAGAIIGAIVTAVFLRGNTKTKEFEKLKTGQLEPVIEELLQNGVITYSELYKARNASKIAKKADKYFAEKKYSVQNVTYDFDWFMRFYEEVGNISDEDMQDIWARILAGEINQPSSYSLRLLDILKNMSKKEAELFIKICSCCVSTESTLFIPNYEEYMEKCGISYDEIMRLSEMGLMYNDALLVLRVSVTKEPGATFCNQDIALAFKGTHMRTVEVKQFPLTRVGYELASIFDHSISDEKMITLGDILNSRYGDDVTVSAHRRVQTEDGRITFYKTDLLAKEYCVVDECDGNQSESGKI